MAKRAAKDEAAEVATLLAGLDHPLKDEIVAVRGWILGVDPTIAEAVKWNAPSFRTTEFFATFHLRATDTVTLILHTGAKARAAAFTPEIPDETGLLKWLAKDRAMVTLGRGPAVAEKRAALEAIVRRWIDAM